MLHRTSNGTRFRGGHVFRDSSGKPYVAQRNRMGKAFTDSLVKVGLRRRGTGRKLEYGPSFKTLRRTTASWAGDAGFTETHIGQTLGHSRGRSMTSRYIRLNRDTLRGIILALDDAEQGLDPPMAPPGQKRVEAVQGKSPNTRPAK